MIDYKALAKQHGPTVGIAAFVAAFAVFAMRPRAPSTPSSPSIPVKPEVESAPSMPRCTGVTGDALSGQISVHERGISGCWIAFRTPFDHDPSCTVEVAGSIDADHRFDKAPLPAMATRDRLTIPGAQERMLLRYTCK